MRNRTIGLDYLHKSLVEALYNGELSSDQLAVYHRIIGNYKAEKEEEAIPLSFIKTYMENLEETERSDVKNIMQRGFRELMEAWEDECLK